MTVIGKRLCLVEGCKKRCSFNFPGESRAMYCKTHIEDGMVDIVRPRCVVRGCGVTASFFWPTLKLSHCFQHKEPGQVNKRQRCACGKRATHADETYCRDCLHK